jgi:hypothetical protein
MKNKLFSLILLNLKSSLLLLFILLGVQNTTFGCSANGWPVSITSNVTWMNDTTITSTNIIVETGAMLTIQNCTVQFYTSGQISVKAGGHLVVSNSVLTVANCATYWNGIQDYMLNGDPAPNSAYILQGGHYTPNYADNPRVDIFNSKIFQAFSGVDFEHYQGIVDIENSTIIANNGVSITANTPDMYAVAAL